MTTAPVTAATPQAPHKRKAKKRRSSALKWVIGFVVMMIVGMGSAFFITKKNDPNKDKSRPEDIASNQLSRPGLNHDEVNEWILEIIPASTKLNSAKFYNQLAELEPYYTKEGWKYYNGMLERYDVVKLLKKGNFSTVPQIDGEPEYLEEGVENKAYYWKIKLKMTLSMRSDTRRLDQPMAAHIRLVRVPTAFREDGIAIAALNFLPTGPAVPVK